MGTPLDPALEEEMRKRAQSVKDRMKNADFTRSWQLTGKNTIVQPGSEVVARLAPRWDYAQSMTVQGDKRIPNPAYRRGRPAFVVAIEHWWEDSTGKTTHAWCPRTLDAKAACEVCRCATVMLASATKDDKEFGKRIRPQEVYIFNAVVGAPRRVDDKGLADIRILPLSGVLFTQISDIMTGGENKSFARGDITDPRTGRDLKLVRPAKGGGERWRVDCADESPLYSPEQAAAFKGWVTRLTDLDEMLKKEVMTPLAIFKAFQGRDPEPGELDGTAAEAPDAEVDETVDAVEVDEPGAADTVEAADAIESPDDDFLPPPTQPAKPAAAGARPAGRPAPPKAPPAKAAPPRGRGR